MSSEEKTESPTSHKLREARKRGEVAFSRDLTGAAGFLAAFGMVWLSWDQTVARLEHTMAVAMAWISRPGLDSRFDVVTQQMLADMLWIVVPPLMAAVIVATLMALIQTRGVLSSEPMALRFERMNPGASISQLFSSRQGIELLKMLFKLAMLLGAVLLLLRIQVPVLVQQVYSQPVGVAAAVGLGLGTLFAWAAGIFLVLGLIDYGHQYYEFMKQNRMSKSERKQEHRNHEGDPHLRSELRRRRKEMIQSPMKLGVRNASVVVTNPTHFAVALYYEPGAVDLPVVVAKGVDADAWQIRVEAHQRFVPIVENPPLARSLFRSVNLGEAIDDEHVDSVAEVFRWLASLKGSGEPC